MDVYVWRAADADGVEEIWEDQRDTQGNNIGRQLKRDNHGNPVKRYPAPEGFRNIPSSDGAENYVLFEEGKGAVRDPDGNAVTLREGQAVVVQADGRAVALNDEYSQYLFSLAHDAVDHVDEDEDDEEKAPPKKATKKASK